MSYAIRKDGRGWRAVGGPEDVGDDEVFSDIAPPTPIDYAEQNKASLWRAAHDYEYAQISGSAIGLLVLGVLQSKPMCLAVDAWIKSIWVLYYQRVAQVPGDAAINQSLLDFSSCGPMPHTVPELMAEVG